MKVIYNFLKMCITKKPDVMLGRWNLKHDCLKKETISMFYANSDHCGDKICGNVIENRKLLENKISKITDVKK